MAKSRRNNIKLKYKILYPGLEPVLLALKEQVKDSLKFAHHFLPPGAMTPAEIFVFLKNETVYRNDPDGIELLQSMQTVFTEENVHGLYGAADCDCMTICSLASLYVKGYRNIGIYLVGRSPSAPVHIYAAIYGVPFDLTNKKIGQERKYPYRQYLAFKL